MKALPVFGAVRACKQVGQHPQHAELRRRNEERLAALKQRGQLTESKEKHPK